MSKTFKSLFIVFTLFILVFIFISFKNSTNEKQNSASSNSNDINTIKNNDNLKNEAINDSIDINTNNGTNSESEDIPSSKTDTSASNKSNTKDSKNDDYTIVVSSNIYNAVVSLDKTSKEINIKLVDENLIDDTSGNRYINFTDEEIKYLLSNSSELMSTFKNSNLFEKYDMVSKMLSEFDTDIKESDLIGLAMSYLKNP